jgi:hypothetical protein
MVNKITFCGKDDHHPPLLDYYDLADVSELPVVFVGDNGKKVAAMCQTSPIDADLFELLNCVTYKRSKMISHLVQDADPRGVEMSTFGYMDRTSKQRFAKLTRPSHNYPDVWAILAKHMINQSIHFRTLLPRQAKHHDFIQENTNAIWKINQSCFSTLSVWKNTNTIATSTNKNLARNSWIAFNAVAPFQGIIGHLIFARRMTAVPVSNASLILYNAQEPVYFQQLPCDHIRNWFFTQSYLRRNLVSCGGVNYELKQSELEGALYSKEELAFSRKVNSTYRF